MISDKISNICFHIYLPYVMLAHNILKDPPTAKHLVFFFFLD